MNKQKGPKKTLIDKNIGKFINDNFDKRDRKKDESIHFEWFTNSMHIWHNSSVFFNSDSKIGKKITLGTSEGGDAFFISVNNFQKIFSLQDSIDDVVDYIKKEGKFVTFHFIQSKKTTSIDWRQMMHLFEIPLKIWKGSEFDKSQPKLIAVQNFIDSIVDDDDSVLKKIEHKLDITFYTIKDQTSIVQIIKDWNTNIAGKIGELGGWFTKDRISVNIRGSEFLNSIYERINSNDYELFVNKNNVINTGQNEYLIGFITAKELLDSIAPVIEGERTLYTDVFKNNIRLYLGGETAVNRNIEKTLLEEPTKFHYYNNGLTITTKEIDSSNTKNFKIKPVNIVNGCQTANSIFNVAKSKVAFPEEDVKIPVRIIIAENEAFENITIRTNTQNGLDVQDLISITTIQKDLEEEFSKKKFHNKSFHYKRQKSNDDLSSLDVDFIIQIDDILRSTFSTLMLIPNRVSGYFDKTTARFIDHIFKEELTNFYLVATTMLKLIEDEIETLYPTLSRQKYHVSYLVYKYLNKGLNLAFLEEFIRNKKDEEDYSDEENKDRIELIRKIISNYYRVLNDKDKFDKLLKYIVEKIQENYPDLIDLSTKEKERILYKPVEKLPRIRAVPVFENFDTVFIEKIDTIIN